MRLWKLMRLYKKKYNKELLYAPKSQLSAYIKHLIQKNLLSKMCSYEVVAKALRNKRYALKKMARTRRCVVRKPPLKKITVKTTQELDQGVAAPPREAAGSPFAQQSDTCATEAVKHYLAECGSKCKPAKRAARGLVPKKKTMMTLSEQEHSLSCWVSHAKEDAFTMTCTKTWSNELNKQLVAKRKIRENVTRESIRHLVGRFQTWHKRWHPSAVLACSPRYADAVAWSTRNYPEFSSRQLAPTTTKFAYRLSNTGATIDISDGSP